MQNPGLPLDLRFTQDLRLQGLFSVPQTRIGARVKRVRFLRVRISERTEMRVRQNVCARKRAHALKARAGNALAQKRAYAETRAHQRARKTRAGFRVRDLRARVSARAEMSSGLAKDVFLLSPDRCREGHIRMSPFSIQSVL